MNSIQQLNRNTKSHRLLCWPKCVDCVVNGLHLIGIDNWLVIMITRVEMSKCILPPPPQVCVNLLHTKIKCVFFLLLLFCNCYFIFHSVLVQIKLVNKLASPGSVLSDDCDWNGPHVTHVHSSLLMISKPAHIRGCYPIAVLQARHGHSYCCVFPWRCSQLMHPCSFCHWLQLVRKAVLPKHILPQRASLEGVEKIGSGDLKEHNSHTWWLVSQWSHQKDKTDTSVSSTYKTSIDF